MNASADYGIRSGYAAREQVRYFEDTFGHDWQPDVYRLAFEASRRSDATTILDLGCGRASKLVDCGLQVIGVDYGDNLHHCQARYPEYLWIERNLNENCYELRNLGHREMVVVCADVIEHLVYPHYLMDTLAALSERCAAVIVSTPDRERLYGCDHDGPPSNPHHVREWTLDELTRWMAAQYFPVRTAGWTLPHIGAKNKTTALVMDIVHPAVNELGIEVWR